MHSPSNYAAYQTAPGQHLSIRPAPYTTPGPYQIIIEAAAWAVNPADHILQSRTEPDLLQYPVLPGADVAGTVHAIGPGVTALRPGDRVCAFAVGAALNAPSEGAFQQYVVVREALTMRIPRDMHCEDAVVLPMALATAAAGLFQRDALGLQLPRAHVFGAHMQAMRARRAERPSRTVVIWGGSSAVGCNAIQLAAAAGYGVIATGAAADAASLKSLGAGIVFDAASPRVIEDVVKAVNALGGRCAGIFQAAGAVGACLEVAARANGDIFVATIMAVPDDKPADVCARTVLAASVIDSGIGRAVFREFMPAALESGLYRVAPQPWVVGAGLETLQKAIDVVSSGVCARKIVVSAS